MQQKKKLLMLLGAGSSLAHGIGMPSVSDLDKCMSQWAQAWSAQRKLPDYFGALSSAAATYYASVKYHSSETAKIGPQLNFEKVLGDMVALSNWMTPPPYGNTIRQIACAGAAPQGLAFPAGEYGAVVAITDQLTFLLLNLAEHMRACCRGLDKTTADFLSYKRLLLGLADRFDIGVYNLNYDDVAVRALGDAFTGFDKDGVFDPPAVHSRQEWGFVYHLHGSVHHTLHGQFGNSIRWQDDLAGKFWDGDQGLSGDKRSEGKTFPRTTLIAGGFKLDQLLIEPFQSFYASFIRHINEADAIVVGGYGFGDVHVNRVFQNRMERTGRAPVAVLTWSSPGEDPMAFRRDVWSLQLCRSLAASGHYFREPGHDSTPFISDLVRGGGCEVSSPHHVAIWHGGFIEAAPHINRIADWLDMQADDAILAAQPLRTA